MARQRASDRSLYASITRQENASAAPAFIATATPSASVSSAFDTPSSIAGVALQAAASGDARNWHLDHGRSTRRRWFDRAAGHCLI
ncbi:hypothetical protein C7S14_2765 [Burkholderia cepacia]|nr:hypothetical protein C7S14_2765 [Burkholderia cepacia]